MAFPSISITTPEHIEYIIKYKRRWRKDVVLRMLKDARAKLFAFRNAHLVTADEFKITSHKITVAQQEARSGQHQN